MLQPVLSQCGALQVWVHIEPPERSWERAVSHHFHPARELERKSYTQANYGRVLGGCYVIFQRQWNGVGLEFQWAHWLKSFLYSRSWAICGGASSLNAGESPLAEKKLTACWDLPAAPVGGFSIIILPVDYWDNLLTHLPISNPPILMPVTQTESYHFPFRELWCFSFSTPY